MLNLKKNVKRNFYRTWWSDLQMHSKVLELVISRALPNNEFVTLNHLRT